MNKKTRELIDKYCTGFELTDAQQDEIFNMVSQMGDNLKEVAEYMQNLLYGLTPEEVKAGKRAKPDSTPIKYTVTIKWIPNLLVGMMATQNVLGWSSAESRKKLSKDESMFSEIKFSLQPSKALLYISESPARFE